MEYGRKIYAVIFILGFLIAASSFAENLGVPELPAQYYGKIISPKLLNGYVEVRIDGKTYDTIDLINNTFGGPTYLDDKLLVYAPGKENKEVKFYLNGSILLETVDTIKYKPGDIRYVELYYSTHPSDGKSSRRKGDETVSEDIRSEKIKEFVSRAKLIVGSEVDLNLSARDLK